LKDYERVLSFSFILFTLLSVLENNGSNWCGKKLQKRAEEVTSSER
jgi:hypothetical protein